MTKPDQKTIGIAELMVRAGFLSDEDLHEALEIAKRTDQEHGRVLLMSAFVTDQQLNLARNVQEQLKNGNLDLDEAINSLRATQP